MSELIVHIGLHKTGSTSIQQALNADHEMLLKQGVYVPETATFRRRKGHLNIAWELNEDSRFRPRNGTVDDMLAELAPRSEPVVVISSEDFSRFRPGKMRQTTTKYARLRQLANALSRRLTVIAFVRDYPSAINSAYTQQIRTFSHAMPFANYLQREASNERWLYSQVFLGYEEVADRVTILPFKGDVIGAFYAQLNASLRAEGYPRANVGFGPQAIEACRILFRHYSSALRDDGGLASGGPAGQIRQIADELGWNKTSFWGFEPEQARKIHETLSSRDSNFFSRHDITFESDFSKRVPNDRHLEQMSEKERSSFLQGLGYIVATCSARAAEEPVKAPRRSKDKETRANKKSSRSEVSFLHW